MSTTLTTTLDDLRPAPAIPDVERRLRVRDRYPTDAPSQAAIDQKYARREGPGWTPIPLIEIVAQLELLIADRAGLGLSVQRARFLTGGASKIQVAFDLVNDKNGSIRPMLLRMDPPETLNATNKRTEFELIAHARKVIPAPECVWTDESAEFLPEPGLLFSFASGVSKPSAGAGGNVSGIGINFGARLREPLGDQFVRALAALHGLDTASFASDAVAVPQLGTTESALWRLNFERQLWELDRLEDTPLMDAVGNWLARNAPTLDHSSLVHGDYRSGNFLFNEESATLTALLDWESAHVGDRHLDLAYAMQDHFAHVAEDGKTLLVVGLMPAEEFVQRYQDASGFDVDPDRLRWYRMLTNYSSVVKTIATSRRVASMGRSHQDILLARFEGITPSHLRLLEADMNSVI